VTVIACGAPYSFEASDQVQQGPADRNPNGILPP
jgi:hypothetical protein